MTVCRDVHEAYQNLTNYLRKLQTKEQDQRQEDQIRVRGWNTDKRGLH